MEKNLTAQQNRITFMDTMRIFAVLAVVLIHVVAQCWGKVDIYTPQWMMYNLLDSIPRWGEVMFVMMSGVLFLGKDRSGKQIFQKNVRRMIICFVIWSALYALFYYGIGTYTAELAWWRLWVGNYHLWFLWMISALYMSVPVLRKIAESESATKYFLVLSFVFGSLIPQVAEVVGLFSDTYGAMGREMIANFRYGFATGYVFYFLCGYYLYHKELSPKCRRLIYIMGIVSALAVVGATQLVSWWKGYGTEMFYGDQCIGVVGMSIAVFVFGKYNLSYSEKWGPLVRKLSQYSFGVYLVHPMVLDVLDHVFHIHTLSFNTFLATPVVFILVSVISFGVAALLSHIPVLKKYMV